MIPNFKTALVGSGLLLSLAGYGQGINLPLGALPMQYNGSFAGETNGPRISSNFGLQTARRFYGRTYLAIASYDQFIPAIRSGIGLTVGYGDFYSIYTINASRRSYSSENYQVALAIAPKFSIKGKFTLSPSL
ncbi:MAG: hypothetical protein H7Z75_18565, partial [Ferruginibacter sp.]|nr:hypothetical protein [Cytophagales bacterium]